MKGRLVIYHTSDIHARSGFGDALAEIVEPHALVVDSGDALAGSSIMYFPNEPVMQEMARAPYRAMAVGNREFHYLHSAMLARARMLSMPLVCSNLVDLRGRTPAFARELRLEVDSQPVRIVAALVPQYRTGSGWEKIFGWRFLDPSAGLEEVLGQNPRRDIPTILLSHLGLGADREIAASWPSLCAILGGHTHETLTQPEIVNGVPIAHPGPFAAHVGRLEISLGESGTVVESYGLIPLRAGSKYVEGSAKERPTP